MSKPLPLDNLPDKLDKERELHNGYGWEDFNLRMMMKVPVARIARDFNISRERLSKAWIPAYKRLKKQDK